MPAVTRTRLASRCWRNRGTGSPWKGHETALSWRICSTCSICRLARLWWTKQQNSPAELVACGGCFARTNNQGIGNGDSRLYGARVWVVASDTSSKGGGQDVECHRTHNIAPIAGLASGTGASDSWRDRVSRRLLGTVESKGPGKDSLAHAVQSGIGWGGIDSRCDSAVGDHAPYGARNRPCLICFHIGSFQYSQSYRPCTNTVLAGEIHQFAQRSVMELKVHIPCIAAHKISFS